MPNNGIDHEELVVFPQNALDTRTTGVNNNNNNNININNNYYVESYCEADTNTTVFNEFQLNTADMHWSQSINH